MTVFLAAWIIAVVAIVGLALALPCKGCLLRRERLRQAYENWKNQSRGGN